MLVRRTLASAVLCLALAAGSASALHAQWFTRQQAHQDALHGFWLGAGAGGAWVRESCYACPNATIAAASAYVRFGITLAPRVRLGLEAGAWRRSEHVTELIEDRAQRLSTVRLVGLLYPLPRGGFHVQLGIGLAWYVAVDRWIGRVTTAHVSPSAGLGYDVRLAKDLKLDAHIDGLMGPPANFYINGVRMLRGYHSSLTFWQAGLGLTWH